MSSAEYGNRIMKRLRKGVFERWAYWASNQEAGEEVEERVEESAEDGRQDEVRRDGHHHHSVECVDEQADE